MRLDGAVYVIGRALAAGGGRFVHDLLNHRFGRPTHEIQILRHHRNNPPPTDDHTVIRAHGGVFELRERVSMTPAEASLQAAVDVDQIAAQAERILTSEPNNFVALNSLALAVAKHGDPLAGLNLAVRAVEIEPYTRACKVTVMQCALAAAAFSTFWWQFNDLRTKWPNDHCADDLAAMAHLIVGAPEKATDLRLQDDIAEEVAQALNAKKAAHDVMGASFTLEDTKEHNTRNREILRQAYELYDRAPLIAVNFGLAQLRCGEGKAAHDTLAKIVPVLPARQRAEFVGYMAFALAVDGDCQKSYELLKHMTELLGTKIKPADLPGWPLWWNEQENTTIQAKTHKPIKLIAHVIATIGVEKIPTPIHRMALLYEHHPANPT